MKKISPFRKSRIVPKNVKGDPSGFINIHSVAKYQKTRRGDLLGTLKNFRKKSHSAEKNPKGDLLGTSGFAGFLEKVKNERGTLWTKFAVAGLGLRWFHDFFLKTRTDQCEDCSLKKKQAGIGPNRRHI